jgi:2-keto-4-pentenoate hydratase/2-oxohepta-3-ene-1,7-dioic acid hydratase in catechol pathway
MKVATVLVAGERRVGQITKDETSIAPFDWAFSQVQDGIQALIRHKGAGVPPTPSATSQVTIEAPIPVRRCKILWVGKNCHEHAHEFARCGFDTSSANGVVPGITLQPGDVIASGTSAGVGIGFDPPKYLKAGDVTRIEIGGIGALENEVVEGTT